MKLALEKQEDVEKLLSKGFEIYARPILIIQANEDVFLQVSHN